MIVTALTCFDSIFNFLKRATGGIFFIFMNFFYNIILFLPFLNVCTQIRCLQNHYTVLKSASDQPLPPQSKIMICHVFQQHKNEEVWKFVVKWLIFHKIFDKRNGNVGKMIILKITK